ncbi:MAG: hypothetical protein KatS3mg029_0793 [Saprospiraceae bacterium]|nr:MAG: hypothetical protein KatS3mg029_0793 [Saprospiraceae bacterium]
MGNNDRENLANLFNTLVQIPHGSTGQLSDTTDQRQVFNKDASDYSASLTWTEPVGEGKTIGLRL